MERKRRGQKRSGEGHATYFGMAHRKGSALPCVWMRMPDGLGLSLGNLSSRLSLLGNAGHGSLTEHHSSYNNLGGKGRKSRRGRQADRRTLIGQNAGEPLAWPLDSQGMGPRVYKRQQKPPAPGQRKQKIIAYIYKL